METKADNMSIDKAFDKFYEAAELIDAVMNSQGLTQDMSDETQERFKYIVRSFVAKSIVGKQITTEEVVAKKTDLRKREEDGETYARTLGTMISLIMSMTADSMKIIDNLEKENNE